jgi:hypothetical protein
MATAASFGTYLAPGQRYTQPDGPAWRADRQVTVARLDRDPLGLTRVTFHCPDGTELTLYATQVETAIADGNLTPVVGTGWTARC